jgi:hypothetical protein
MAVVAPKAASGYVGGNLAFTLTSSADGDAAEGPVDSSGHEPGDSGPVGRRGQARIECCEMDAK